MEGKVMTVLFRGPTAKARIIRHVFQRTRNGSVLAEGNTALKIAGALAKQILRTGVRRYGQP